MIIGITGSLSSGKGTVVELLVKKGFKHYSVRDFLIEELRTIGLPVNRDNLVGVGNQLREMNHPAYIVEKLYERAKLVSGDCVIESLRTSGEINSLKQKGEFYLIAVDADQQIRYERAVNRQSETDKISFEKFLEDEKREMFSDDPNKQNLSKCIEMADFVLVNNGSIEELNEKLNEVFEKIKDKKRPSWDEYFMEIAMAVAKRATCDRGKSGCVIARDKQILVTGYVGSPKGLPHCDEVGHQMKSMIHEDGKVTNHCVRTAHAEQNAICQAAKLGISINGATLYCKMTPCPTCAKMIINTGIKRVVCEKRYHASDEDLFKQAGIPVDVLNDEVEKYENQ